MVIVAKLDVEGVDDMPMRLCVLLRARACGQVQDSEWLPRFAVCRGSGTSAGPLSDIKQDD